DPNNPDYQIRKYAKETNTPGLYDVYLNVKGNTQQNVKPVDIVLVVDMSGSMESNSNHTNRAGAVRTGVKNFLTSIQ
ncbi:VWA domain-containing protein, partial [Lacticaseibacillus paracasei]